MQTPSVIRVGEEVRRALEDGAPVLALESTILSHGLPSPRNLEVGLGSERLVGEAGVVPATIGVVDGVPVVGLTADEIERLCTADGVVKVSVRDLPIARAHRQFVQAARDLDRPITRIGVDLSCSLIYANGPVARMRFYLTVQTRRDDAAVTGVQIDRALKIVGVDRAVPRAGFEHDPARKRDREID